MAERTVGGRKDGGRRKGTCPVTRESCSGLRRRPWGRRMVADGNAERD